MKPQRRPETVKGDNRVLGYAWLLLAGVVAFGCGGTLSSAAGLAVPRQETQELGNGRFVTTLHLPVAIPNETERYCVAGGPCVQAQFHPINVRGSAFLLALKMDNPTDHPLSVRWRCPYHQEGNARTMRGEADYWHIYKPGTVMSVEPIGRRCVVTDGPVRLRTVEIELTWADHDADAAAREVARRKESEAQAARVAAHARLQKEMASKIRHTAEKDWVFRLTPDLAITVRKHHATLSGDPNAEFGSTISRVEFLDGSGNVLLREEFPVVVADERNFSQSCSMGFRERLLGADQVRVIEMQYDCLPSAPGYSAVRWYAFDKEGRFRQVRSPLDGFSGGLVDAAGHPALKPGRIYASIWTGYAGIVVPFVYDRGTHALSADYSDRYLVAEGVLQTGKPPRIMLRDQPRGKILATITLAAHSKTRFLRVFLEDLERQAPSALPNHGWVNAMPWMEVEVDGQRGWVNLREDEGLRDALVWAG